LINKSISANYGIAFLILQLNDNMPEDQKQLGEEEKMNQESRGDSSAPDEKFQSDTQKIIHRHLSNEDDIITEEDIRNVRVGMTPRLDEATESRFEDETSRDEAEEKIIGEEGEEKISGKEGPVTPWDIIDRED
jgi:hypothetical protein